LLNLALALYCRKPRSLFLSQHGTEGEEGRFVNLKLVNELFAHFELAMPETSKYKEKFYFFRPDGEKKAYVRLAPDYDALDVANKVSFNSSA
ncbi:hypothetical protein XENOCAPTIV_005913, partial [Xenoophorus captivus]